MVNTLLVRHVVGIELEIHYARLETIAQATAVVRPPGLVLNLDGVEGSSVHRRIALVDEKSLWREGGCRDEYSQYGCGSHRGEDEKEGTRRKGGPTDGSPQFWPELPAHRIVHLSDLAAFAGTGWKLQ